MNQKIELKSIAGVSSPNECTYLTSKLIKELKFNSMLEIGTGTGYISISTFKNKKVQITATDITQTAIKCAKENAKKNNAEIKFIKSNLFKNVKGKYDLIVFNPPWGNTNNSKLAKPLEFVKSLLPSTSTPLINITYLLIKKDRKKLIKKFLSESKNYLSKNGKIILVLYNPELNLIKRKEIYDNYIGFNITLIEKKDLNNFDN